MTDALHTGLGALAPETDADSAVFWSELAEGELAIPRCGACGHAFFPPMPACPRCGSPQVVLERASGRGTVNSWVTVHMALHEAFAADVPYTVVAVDLDEGGRMLGRLLDTTEAAAGMRVRLRPYEADGYVLPGFEAEPT